MADFIVVGLSADLQGVEMLDRLEHRHIHRFDNDIPPLGAALLCIRSAGGPSVLVDESNGKIYRVMSIDRAVD